MVALWKNRKIKDEILGINERNMEFVYKLNPKNYFVLADDKIKTKEILHTHQIACAETYELIDRVGDIPLALTRIEKYNSIAIKPAKGSGGGGIKILKKDDNNNWLSGDQTISDDEIASHMARIMMGMYSFGNSDRVLVEACIIPDPFFHAIYPAGVPDFRVILVHDEPVMSMLRLPTDKSDGKANLHQGGLGIGIDMSTGKLNYAFDGKRYHETHPDNGHQILGLDIPKWEAILALSIATSKCFPLNYLGIDIVLDAQFGPMIMEINVRPGLGIQLANKEGLKKYLNN